MRFLLDANGGKRVNPEVALTELPWYWGVAFDSRAFGNLRTIYAVHPLDWIMRFSYWFSAACFRVSHKIATEPLYRLALRYARSWDD